MGVTDRAIQTLPPGLEVRKSSIPDADLGVFNKGAVIPIGVHFGPYEGGAMDNDFSVMVGLFHTKKPQSNSYGIQVRLSTEAERVIGL